ncbi:MAG: sensor domain-containing diguanylate cyclase [Chloroflexota bacterium]
MTPLETARPQRARRVIRDRLVLSVAGLLVLTIALTIGGSMLMSLMIDGVSDQALRAGALDEFESELHLALLEQQTLALRSAYTPHGATLAGFSRAVEAEFDAYVQLGALDAGGAAHLAAANIRQSAKEWRDSWAEPFFRIAAAGSFEPSPAMLDDNQRRFAPVLAALEELDGLADVRREAAATALGGVVRDMDAFVIPAVIGIFVLVGTAGTWLIRSIDGPLHRLNRTAEALVAGEEVMFMPERNDEIGALAIVLERLRLDAAERYNTARGEAETAATFNQLAELTAFAQNEETLIDVLTRVLQRIAPSPRGQVMLLNNSTNRLIVAATWGEGLPAIGSAADIDRTDRCPGIRRATAFVADDVSDELAVRCPAHPAERGSVVCLPMPALGGIVGVIHLERPEPHSFDAVTVQRAARTAEQVALALANARLMKTMEGLANTDPLTGLRNARFFDAYLEQQLALAERENDSVGVIMLDVDNFKAFNDTHGHPAGDEALQALSRAVRSTIRASDVVARYGGEEFVIALHHATLAEVKVVAEKIRAAIEQTVVEIGPGRYGRITASLGIVATDTHHADRKGLVSLADAALYRAKAAGRNQVGMAQASMSDIPTTPARRRRDLAIDEPLVLPVVATVLRPRPRRTRKPKASAA